MKQGIRMRVTTQIVGNHDPRILVGSNPKSGICWEGGEEIVVTEELANNYEKSGIAVRIPEKPESAMLGTAEAAVLPAASRRPRNVIQRGDVTEES